MTQREGWMTVEEAAAVLQMHADSVRRLLREGRLPGRKVGGRWWIAGADLWEVSVQEHMREERQLKERPWPDTLYTTERHAPEGPASSFSRLLAEADLLQAITIEAAGREDLGGILAASLSHLARLIPFTGASIAVVEGDELVIRAAMGPFKDVALGQRLPRGRGLSWRLVEAGESLLSDDLVGEGYRPLSPMRSYLAVPLIWRERVFGLLELDSTSPHAFTRLDLQLMQKVAAVLSGHIELAARYAAEARATAAAAAAQQRLTLQHAVSQLLLAESMSLSELAPTILREMGQQLQFDLGIVWEAEPHAGQLHFNAIWHRASLDPLDMEVASRASHFRPGEGLPGQVWATGEPIWLAGVRRDRPSHHQIAARLGLRGVLAFPLRGQQGILGVVELFGRRREAPGREWLDLLVMLGRQIGRFLEDRQIEARQGAIIQGAPDAIISINHQGRIAEWNPAAEKLFGYSRSDVLGKALEEVVIPPRMRARYREKFAHYLATGESTVLGRRMEMRALCRDGSERPVELIVSEVPSDGPPMFTGFVRDISDRKESEAALREANQRALKEYGQLLGRLTALAEAVGTANSVRAIYRALLDFILASIPCNALFVSHYNPSRQSYSCAYSWANGAEIDTTHLPPFPMSHDPHSRAIATGQTVVVADRLTLPPEKRDYDQALRLQPFRSSVSVPMTVLGRVIGGFEVHSLAPDAYHREHVAVLEMAANLAAIATENMLLLERERHQRRLAEASEQRYRELLQGLEAVVWEADAATLQFTFVSQQAELLIGYPVEQWLQEPDFWTRHVHWEDREGVVTQLQALLEQGQEHELEYRVITADGRSLWLRTFISILRDETGRAQKLRGLMLDITERRRAEEAQRFLASVSQELGRSLDYETTLANVAHLAVPQLADWCVVDVAEQDGTIQQMAIAHIDPAKEALVRELRQCYPPSPSANHPILRALRSGRAQIEFEVATVSHLHHIQDEGHLALLQALGIRSHMVVPLALHGQTLGTISFIFGESGRRYDERDLDLAEELARRAALAVENARLYREAQEAIQARDTFFSIASHDLKAPIATIHGYAALLQRRARRTAGNETMERSLQIIYEQSKRLNRLIDLLLDLSRIQHGQIKIERLPVDLSALLRQIIEVVQPTLDKHTLVLVTPSDPVRVEGDELRLDQLFRNLLSNAIKYSPNGGTITFRLEPREEQVAISVTDEGIGIPPDEVTQLFERFYRAGNAIDYQLGGMGLGLYIVRHIVEAHDGQIYVKSEPGLGSTFTVELSRLDPASPTSPAR